MSVSDFQALAERVKTAGIKFVIEPHIRFVGQPGEQVNIVCNTLNYLEKVEASLFSSECKCSIFCKRLCMWSLHIVNCVQELKYMYYVLQWTMFFKDYSGNAIDFEAMTTPSNLFAKYTVE